MSVSFYRDNMVLNATKNIFVSPSSAENENVWIYVSTPPIYLHGVMLN